jgi:hypothetical protein
MVCLGFDGDDDLQCNDGLSRSRFLIIYLLETKNGNVDTNC